MLLFWTVSGAELTVELFSLTDSPGVGNSVELFWEVSFCFSSVSVCDELFSCWEEDLSSFLSVDGLLLVSLTCELLLWDDSSLFCWLSVALEYNWLFSNFDVDCSFWFLLLSKFSVKCIFDIVLSPFFICISFISSFPKPIVNLIAPISIKFDAGFNFISVNRLFIT